MNPYTTVLFYSTMFLGTMMVLSSSHWLLAWVGLEMNMFAVLPLMAQNHHPRALEATLKYFIIQALAAMMLLFASTSNAWLSGQWNIQHMTHPIPLALVTIALSLKLGLAPVHSWYPEIMQGLNLKMGLILSTWQKLAPLILFLQIPSEHSFLYVLLGLTSTLIGGWGGLNQTQLRKMLAYSSIAHMGWTVLIMQYSPYLAFLTFFFYVIITTPLFMTFYYLNTTMISSLSASWTKIPLLTSIAPLIILSLGGLPPLTGFLPKWMIIFELTKQGLLLVATVAALSTLLSLFFYLRLSYVMALTIPPNNLPSTLPWRLPPMRAPLLMAVLTVLSLLLLPLLPTIIAFLPA
uniref:NADH-ubiquinone oxidoreductase chain 2 n=1 Tax=Nematolebias whitei TaxID=451745 RepID=Q9TD55_NEMWH|nr:NADH dehydrogenase subunit II [Nematolebias whitei]